MISYVYMYAMFSDLEKLKKQVNNQYQQDTHLLFRHHLKITLILTPECRIGCDENAHPYFEWRVGYLFLCVVL